MRKIFGVAVLLSACALWLPAQSGRPGTDNGANASGQQITVNGCLQHAEHVYTITDRHGRVYRLDGDASQLSGYVGHEVQVTGTSSVKAVDTTQEGAASTEANRTSVQVQNVQDVPGPAAGDLRSEPPRLSGDGGVFNGCAPLCRIYLSRTSLVC